MLLLDYIVITISSKDRAIHHLKKLMNVLLLEYLIPTKKLKQVLQYKKVFVKCI